MASLLVLAASAQAETSYRFEMYGSGNFPFDKDFEIGQPQSSVRLQGHYSFSPGVRGGVRFGVDGLGHWGQDFFYSYGTNATKIAVVPNGEFAFTGRSHQFGYNVLCYPGGLRPRKAYPFLTAGAGGTIYTVSQSTINDGIAMGLGTLQTHTSFIFNAGGGLRYQFTNNYGFRLDVRDWMSHPPRYGIPASSSDPSASVFPVAGVFHQLEVSVAFVYCFRSSK